MVHHGAGLRQITRDGEFVKKFIEDYQSVSLSLRERAMLDYVAKLTREPWNIIENIGMGLGILLWGTANMVTGWASSRFGLLGVHQQPVSNPSLNTVGAVLAIVSMVIYSQVKPIGPEEKRERERAKGLSVSEPTSTPL